MPPGSTRNIRPAEPAKPTSLPLPLLVLLGILMLLCGAALYMLQRVKADVETVRTEQVAIQNNLRELSRLVRQRPAGASQPQPAASPTAAAISIANARIKGRADAPLTLVEFSDYE